jgi:hypothetical protein
MRRSVAGSVTRLPNTRVQRTRSSPSALRSPLTRRPLGGNRRQSLSLASGSVVLALVTCLLASVLGATDEPAPPPGCKWQEIPEIKVSIALPEGWQFRQLSKKGSILVYEVIPAGPNIAAHSKARYELRFQRLAPVSSAVTRAKEQVKNALATAADSTPLEEESIGVVTLFASVGHLSPDASGMPQLIVAVLALGNARTGALYTIRFEIPSVEADAVLPLGNALFRAIRVDDDL